MGSKPAGFDPISLLAWEREGMTIMQAGLTEERPWWRVSGEDRGCENQATATNAADGGTVLG